MTTTRFNRRGLCGAVAAALFLGLAHPALASSQPQWVRQLGTADHENATGVATDRDGNVYIAGQTDGSLGGPFQGGLGDAWIAKYSAAGALRWKRQLGTSTYDDARGVATDGDGNVYIAGVTDGSLGGPNQGYFDAWVAKYSAAGALRWIRQLGTLDYESANAVATDGDGNVYIAGAAPGLADAWVAKYSAAGALRWKRHLGTADEDVASGVATDGDGNVYIAGLTGGSLGGPNQGDWDAWIAKYSAAGALRWKRQHGTSGLDYATGVATDGDGNVYIAGHTELSPAWVAKYSAAGALRWKRQHGTSLDDTPPYGVATDGGGNVYIAGSVYTWASDDFNAWVTKYSTAGALRWERQLGTADVDFAFGVATDGEGHVYIAD